MKRDTFLFDLDNTLVDTSQIEHLRKRQLWPEVKKHLHLVRSYPPSNNISPHQLPQLLKNKGYKIGIVTSSPRSYAQRVIAKFGIHHDVLVSYNDTPRKCKPNPFPFELALQKLKSKPELAFSVGDDWKDAKAAFAAGMFPIGAAWGVSNWELFCANSPDLVFHASNLILTPSRYSEREFYGESEYEPLWHRGTLLWLGPDCTKGFCLGRYFNNSDSRQQNSEYSKMILTFKNNDGNARNFAYWIVNALTKSGIIDQYKNVVCVPPKTTQSHNRFEKLLMHIQRLTGDKVLAYPDGLESKPGLKSLKSLKAYERTEAVDGMFKSNYKWENEGVILIDDVISSGATTEECSRLLRLDDAGPVLVIGLARAQFSIG